MRHLFLLLACSLCSGKLVAQTLAVTDLNLVNVQQTAVLSDQFVLVEGGKIQSTGPMSALPELAEAEYIDGADAYLLPGLADMHVHLEYFHDPAVLWLFLANGVTLVRQMEGNQRLLEWRQMINEGQLPGPEIISAGPILDGSPASDPAYQVIETVERAQHVVSSQRERGYDFIKVYHGLDADVFTAIAAAADQMHMKVAGHVPFRVGLESVLQNQAIDSIEHLEGYDDAIQPADSPFLNRWHWRNMAMAVPVDHSKLVAIAEQTRASGIWNTPTLTVKDLTWLKPENQQVLFSNPNLNLLPASVKEAWMPEQWDDFRRELVAGFGPAEYELLEEGFATSMQIVDTLHQAGAPLLSGTDTPNPFLVPGFSLHQELALLVDAGLTPAEALATSTINVARYLGREQSHGRIAAGYAADAVLVAANPLVDIRNLNQVVAVMVDGQWITQSQIQSRLNQLRDNQSPQ